MEQWIEENVQPVNDAEVDRVLFEHIRPLVDFMNQQGWIIHWHFLRESENWRGRGKQLPLVSHIRFRVRVSEASLQAARTYLTTELNMLLTTELNMLQTNARITDHYRGNHGTPNQEYQGEAANFNETGTNPEGWEITQKWLEAGSEIELTFLKNRFQGVVLGIRFAASDMLHFAANQWSRNHGMLPAGNNMIIQV